MNYLEKAASSGALSHAYCFSGPSQVGKRTLARAVACKVLDVDDIDLERHPNVQLVAGDGSISVEQMRDLRTTLSLSTLGDGWKVAIIDGADQMTVAAQNALLKTLEEPKGKTLVCLITDRPTLLLETIRSRVVTLALRPVATEDLAHALEQRERSPEEAQMLAAQTMGRPGLALDLLSDEQRDAFENQRREAHQFLRSTVAQRFAMIEGWNKQKDDRKSIAAAHIAHWRQALRDGLHASLDIDAPYVALPHRSPTRIAHGLKALDEAEHALRQNVNFQLALQQFALNV